jgi:hypothetical protein
MDRYIGIDSHASSCTLAVVGPSGRKLSQQVVETNASGLVGAIRSIPRPRHLCLEEGTHSAWLHEILSPHVDELGVHPANVVPPEAETASCPLPGRLHASGVAEWQ